MSETTSFLGGAAIAGLAVLLLSRGGAGPTSLAPQPLPSPSITAYAPPPTLLAPSPPAYSADYDDARRAEVEQMKVLLEQQKTETEKLKEQIQKQQAVIETLTTQREVAGQWQNNRSPESAALAEQNSNPVLTGLLWALAGVVLSLGGGIVLVGMFVLLSRQNHNSRTVEVIHPVDDFQSYLDPGRRYIQSLPPRRVRRTRSIDAE